MSSETCSTPGLSDLQGTIGLEVEKFMKAIEDVEEVEVVEEVMNVIVNVVGDMPHSLSCRPARCYWSSSGRIHEGH